MDKHTATARALPLARYFAGGEPAEWFLERVTPPKPEALDRWKQLEREGWDVEAVVAVDGSTMVGLGCRYAD